MNANLEISREGRILRVTLNRPDKRNALRRAVSGRLSTRSMQAQDDARSGLFFWMRKAMSSVRAWIWTKPPRRCA